MSLPGPLLLELRLAFKNCARQHIQCQRTRSTRRSFSNLQPLFDRRTSAKTHKKASPSQSLEPTNDTSEIQAREPLNKNRAPVVPGVSPIYTKELATQNSEATSVSRRRTVGAPIKIIPKAQVTPELSLTPIERLQIEFLTRKPPKTESKKSLC